MAEAYTNMCKTKGVVLTPFVFSRLGIGKILTRRQDVAEQKAKTRQHLHSVPVLSAEKRTVHMLSTTGTLKVGIRIRSTVFFQNEDATTFHGDCDRPCK